MKTPLSRPAVTACLLAALAALALITIFLVRPHSDGSGDATDGAASDTGPVSQRSFANRADGGEPGRAGRASHDGEGNDVSEGFWPLGAEPPRFPEVEVLANLPSTENEVIRWPDPAEAGAYAERSVGGADAPRATVEVMGERFDLRASDNGEFPRVFIAPERQASVALRVPGVGPDERMLVQSVDGGDFPEGGTARLLHTGPDGLLRFDARASHEAGTHRFVIPTATGELVLDLWVGPPSPLRVPPPRPDAG